MDLYFKRIYRGPVKAVILDWAGTTVDFGCMAPAMVFMDVFKEAGIEITVEEARLPMGLNKKDHIRTIGTMPRVGEAWKACKGHEFNEDDTEKLFDAFIPLQLAILPAYSILIPGVLDVQSFLRKSQIKIGTSTGYDREMMDIVSREAEQQGFRPDCVVCSTDVPFGRPAPWMAFQNAMLMNTYPMSSLIKVGDTVADIEEGLNAGMWSIAVVESSNDLGLSLAEIKSMPPQDLHRRKQEIKEKFKAAGAHFVIDTVADLPGLIDRITAMLNEGEIP
jgi:phosphonoacetaldehyde hydrolase